MTADIMIIRRKTIIDKCDKIKEIIRNNTREKEVIQSLKKEDGVVYMEGRIYVPNSKKMREEILEKNHNLVDIGHPGQQRMLELIKRNYWWPGIKEDVKKYVQGCFKCQQNKVQHQKKVEELHPLEISQGPWQKISINIIGSLPRSNKMDAIVVIVD